ncbi:hypothetical protein DDE18_20220 [Nocardioides gansuensis]|uniref:Uncharacterized protein n=1 Tax=Nocardioides gansuensis TaxID=2138300 RepID=A0A2T8F607_9ACTN|nr:hypothetical protein [Nocardioides gansuensis]PVG81135.1 hypothetical protein DDE18_20220 [Nocardioides gansuensis]
MSDARDLEFERDMVDRMLRATQTAVDTVAACFGAGLIDDLAGTLGRELAGRGVWAMSEEWIRNTATRIEAGEAVRLPSVDDLY